MNSIGLRVLLLIGLGVPAELQAAPDVGSQVEELLEVTGMAEALRSLPSMARQQGAAIGGKDELGNAFQEAFVSSFDAEPILERTESEIVAHYDTAHAASILAWYATPLGKRLRAASEAVNTVAGQAELRAYAEGLEAAPPPQQRIAMMAQLDTVTGSTGQLTEMVVQMSRSLTESIARAMAPEDPAGGGVAEKELDAIRQQIGPLMQNQVLVTLLFTLRNFTDEEVTQYLVFSNSASYQWFNRHSFDGLLAGLSAASGRFAELFAPKMAAAIDVEARDRLRAEARAYGEGREDRECLGESLRRDTTCDGFGCHVQNAAFLRACLEASAKRTDVCSGVPPLEDLQQTVLWRLQQCASLGREDAFCRTLMGSLQRHCVEWKDSVGT